MADQAGRHEPDQIQPLISGTNQSARYDSVFCANTECVLNVRCGDVGVKGHGNWAETADGVITGRQRVGNVMMCDQCAARVIPYGHVRGER